jgi:hypothetical protein
VFAKVVGEALRLLAVPPDAAIGGGSESMPSTPLKPVAPGAPLQAAVSAQTVTP